MKTSNIQTTHPPAIIRGWVRGVSASTSADVAALSWVVMTPAQLTANTDNWNPVDATDSSIDVNAASIIRASTDASRNLTGITAPSPADETLKVLENIGTHNLVLIHNATSTAANRFYCAGDVNITLQPDGSALLLYDHTSARWRVVAIGSGSGGGTGTSLWFNPMNYGAVNDASTDDTTAVNAAIAAWNTAGFGVLYLQGGTGYKCTAALTAITAVGLILGDGMTGSYDGATLTASKLICTSGSANFLTIPAGVSVRGVSLVNTAGSVTAGYGIGGTNMNLCHFTDVSVIGFYTNFKIDGGLWSMTGCYARQSHKYAIDISYAATPDGGDWNITDCYLTDGANSSDAAVHMTSGGGGKILGLKVNGNASGFNHGIDVHLPNGIATTDLQIENCSVENYRGDGIHIQTDAGATFGHITIVGNQIAQDTSTNTTGNGISVTANTAGDLTGAIIADNAILPNGGGSSSGYAIKLTKADRVIVGSVIAGVVAGGYAGILSQTSCTNVLDYTGGVAAGVAISGTPSSGDVPIASSGTAAAWGPGGGVGPAKGTPATSYGTPAAGAPNTYIGTGATISKPTAPDVDFSADVTNNNVTSGHHGLAPKNDGNAAHYLDGSGAYSTPAGTGASATDANIWRPLLGGDGSVITAGAGGEAVMGFGPV